MRKQLLKGALAALLISSSLFAQSNIQSLIKGDRGISREVTRLPEEEQVAFAPQNAAKILGLDANSDLRLIQQERDQQGINYRFQQTLHGIPVENSMYIVQTKNGRAKVFSGSIITESDPMMSARLQADINSTVAIKNAMNFVHATRYAWDDTEMERQLKTQSGIENRPTAELVWYNPEGSLAVRDLILAYKVIIYALEPLSRSAYFVDAATGKIVGSKDLLFYTDATGTAATAYSGTQTIHSDLSGTSYRLRDLTKGSGVVTVKGTSTHADYSSASANWSFTTNDKYALDAHYGVSQTWSFYNANFGRNSVNNAGFTLTSYVNETSTVDNAYWDGSIMHFGVRSLNSAGIVGIDVTGHELTHGVTQYTSNLNYSGESGAMNESMSDIMGKAVQFWSKPTDINWLLSNDMNWAIRNMANPKQYSQPNCYQGTNWYTGTADNGGVHTNSGVGNYFYYLLVTGGSGTNDKGNAYAVTGLGLTSANAIIYRTETTYLTPTSNYASWRTACINAATDLFGATSNEVAQVQNAWYAVGVGTAAGGGGGTCSAPSGLASSGITNSTATLTWANSGASSYNLQWKTTAGATWTTVTGLTGTSYSLSSLSTCTAYQFQVQGVCSATSSSAYSSPASFTTTGCAVSPYCASKGTTSTYEYINKIAIGSISNTSGNNNGYADFTAQNTNLAGGAAASIVMTPGFASTAYREYWVVYIDYNHNGVFTDAGEKVATGNGTAAVTKSFTVPTTALNGATRMRVQMQYGSAPATSCTTYTYGEVEDYTVTITGNAAFNFTANSIDNGVGIYPNPAHDLLNIKLQSTTDSKAQISVYSSFGQLISTTENLLHDGLNSLKLTTANLPNGIYFLLISGETQSTYRFIKE